MLFQGPRPFLLNDDLKMCTISPGFVQSCTWICTILLTDLFNLQIDLCECAFGPTPAFGVKDFIEVSFNE